MFSFVLVTGNKIVIGIRYNFKRVVYINLLKILCSLHSTECIL